MTAWMDADGQAYLVRSVENAFMGISRLAPSLNDTEGLCSYAAQVPRCY